MKDACVCMCMLCVTCVHLNRETAILNKFKNLVVKILLIIIQ